MHCNGWQFLSKEEYQQSLAEPSFHWPTAFWLTQVYMLQSGVFSSFVRSSFSNDAPLQIKTKCSFSHCPTPQRHNNPSETMQLMQQRNKDNKETNISWTCCVSGAFDSHCRYHEGHSLLSVTLISGTRTVKGGVKQMEEGADYTQWGTKALMLIWSGGAKLK